MKGKIIVSVVSIILVVGVAIGIVVAVNKKDGNSQAQAEGGSQSVKVMCQNTDYQNLCHETLSSVQGDAANDPKAYITASMKEATDTIIKALNMSDRLSVDYASSNDTRIKMALDDCKDLLQAALQSMDLSTTVVRENNIYAVHTQTPDLRNWLSAVISYQQSCLDGFDEEKDGEKKIKEQLQQENLDRVQKVTAVSLDIVTDLTNILSHFGLKLDVNSAASRRLLAAEVDSEGFPTWFSAADRKLLARKNWRANIRPNVVVAKDGSGHFKTIKAAIDSYPKGFKGRYVIYVKAGVYAEYVTVPETAVNVLMYGDGPTRTIVTGRKNYAEGVVTQDTATFANHAVGFVAKAMGFENTAGPKGYQAVALRNRGDLSAFVGCHFNGYQDTLFAQSNRQFYSRCVISGTVDFIFGMSATLIQNSKIIVRRPMDGQLNVVTADGSTEKNLNTGIVLQNCEIVPDAALVPVRFQIKTYLGRPWKSCSTTVIMESNLGDFIHPEGWYPWKGTANLDTLYYAEYGNTGPSASVQGRIKWKGYRGVISKAEASQFIVSDFLLAGPNPSPTWLRDLRVPFYPGFARP